MNGIYLTPEGKKAIEDRIAELEQVKHNCKTDYEWNEAVVEQIVQKVILSSATILPVEESWKLIGENTGTFYDDDGEILHSHFKNGVIIQPKK